MWHEKKLVMNYGWKGHTRIFPPNKTIYNLVTTCLTTRQPKDWARSIPSLIGSSTLALSYLSRDDKLPNAPCPARAPPELGKNSLLGLEMAILHSSQYLM